MRLWAAGIALDLVKGSLDVLKGEVDEDRKEHPEQSPGYDEGYDNKPNDASADCGNPLWSARVSDHSPYGRADADAEECNADPNC